MVSMFGLGVGPDIKLFMNGGGGGEHSRACLMGLYLMGLVIRIMNIYGLGAGDLNDFQNIKRFMK